MLKRTGFEIRNANDCSVLSVTIGNLGQYGVTSIGNQTCKFVPPIDNTTFTSGLALLNDTQALTTWNNYALPYTVFGLLPSHQLHLILQPTDILNSATQLTNLSYQLDHTYFSSPSQSKIKLSLNHFQTTTSIWGDTFSFLGLENTYTHSFFFDSRIYVDMSLLPASTQPSLLILLNFDEQVTVTVTQPETIFNCMIQIGGLIGLVKFFNLFTLYHQFKFERELHQQTKKDGLLKVSINEEGEQKEEDEQQRLEDTYSFERFKQMIITQEE